MGEFVRIAPNDIKIGEPLPYAVYDQSGVLLLRAGFVINLERQVVALTEKGCCFREAERELTRRSPAPAPPPPPESEERSSFDVIDLVKLRLLHLFQTFRAGQSQDAFVGQVKDLATLVQEACTHDTDAVLANLHLDYDSSYAAVHHLQAAILCELIGKKLGVADEARLPLICAGLTHDLGLLDIQDRLDRQTSPLSDDDKARIRAHPADGEEMLRTLGVADTAWLDAVRHHHERLDGSGYPDGIVGDALKVPTRVLAIADTYSAMVRDRPYRKAMMSKEAMRSMIVDQGGKTDSRLTQMMIKEIGVFPPGAIVKLANDEIAVVKKRQDNSACPIAYAFIKTTGMPMLTPQRRDTAKAEFAIDGMVPFSNFKASVTIVRGLWLQT